MGAFRLLMLKRIHFILFFTLIKVVLSTGLGKCPAYPSLKKFDIRRMSGTWYEVERSFVLMEMSASCTGLEITVSERGHLLISINTINRWTGSPSSSYGIGIPSYNGSSIFRYKVNNRVPYVIGRFLPGAGQYNIMITDYDRFALVWSCQSISIAYTDHIWILGRSREIPAALRAQIYAIMEDLKLDPDRLIISKNTNCYNSTTLRTNLGTY